MKTKEEVIKAAYEEAGFIWEEIEKMVDMYDGTFKIKDPSQKYSLTGYSKAYSNNLIKAISLTDNGELWLSLTSLQGLVANNGWIKIESEKDLPKEDFMECYLIGKYSNVITLGCFDRRQGHGNCFYSSHGEAWSKDVITHYQPIVKPKPPIY